MFERVDNLITISPSADGAYNCDYTTYSQFINGSYRLIRRMNRILMIVITTKINISIMKKTQHHYNIRFGEVPLN